jgi:ribonuclease HI
MITAFTDGAASGNPGPAGWGAVMYKQQTTKHKAQSTDQSGYVEEIGGPIEDGTNNEAELTAAINVLKEAKNKSAETVTVYTDSSYLIDGATGWVFGWQRNGWKTQSGDSVKNQNLWKQVAHLQADLSVTYTKVSGHAGVPANERADDIATDFAQRLDPDLYAGAADGYGVSLKPQTQDIPDGPVYLSCVDGVVKQHASWAECQKRVDGQDAQYRKVQTKQQKQEVLDEWNKTVDDITD